MDIDEKIFDFLNNFDKNSNTFDIPKETPIRVSTRSAICKITEYVNIDKMVEFYNRFCDGIRFRRESKSYDAYKNLILRSCLDRQFLKEVDKLMIVINGSKKLQRFNSLKMTCIEI